MNSLQYHQSLCGKLAIRSKVKLNTRKLLSLAYTPGVGDVVNHIFKNKKSAHDLTIKGNAIAVITDGSAVLGLGNVGPEAALPVMEGKCAIFKEFAGIDAFPICLATQNTEEIIQTIKNIAPVFAGINLEDISAPRCFEIEKRLQKELYMPIMHDDQHATAIVVLAGLINAVKVVKKRLIDCKIVIVGAGAAGTAIVKLLYYYGIKNLLILDSQGIISPKRNDLTVYKKELAKITNPENIGGNLEDAVIGVDILIGVSVKNLFNKNIVRKIRENPVIFALANPNPEILPYKAKKYGVRIIATGRSDYPNQINNALVFPGFFKGLLENRRIKITEEMKIKAAIALAGLIKKPKINYIIPSIFDKRLVSTITNSLK